MKWSYNCFIFACLDNWVTLLKSSQGVYLLVDYLQKLLLATLAGLFLKWMEQKNPMVTEMNV